MLAKIVTASLHGKFLDIETKPWTQSISRYAIVDSEIVRQRAIVVGSVMLPGEFRIDHKDPKVAARELERWRKWSASDIHCEASNSPVAAFFGTKKRETVNGHA